LCLDVFDLIANVSRDRQRIRPRGGFNGNKYARGTVVPADRVVAFRTQFDTGDIFKTNQRLIVLADDETAKIVLGRDIRRR
jgi:hypothetical protein